MVSRRAGGVHHRNRKVGAGAIELAITVAGMRAGIVPPTANFLGPDPACDLDYVPNVARAMPVRAALSNSFAFGGLNAVIAVRHVNRRGARRHGFCAGSTKAGCALLSSDSTIASACARSPCAWAAKARLSSISVA